MKTGLITLDNVSLTLGSHEVLSKISMEISSHEIVSIIGANGAGKTSLLKIIAGIYKPSKGKIHRGTTRISYVPQKLDFDETLPISVMDFLQLYNKNKSTQDVEKILNSLHGQGLSSKMLGKLSGGQLQKVLIAQALLSDPEVILLDEPTTGIDAMGETTFFELLNTLHSKNHLTIILVSHDMHTVFSHSTKVLCLNKHICCIGKPDDVSKNSSFQEIFGHHLAPYHHKHDHCVHHQH